MSRLQGNRVSGTHRLLNLIYKRRAGLALGPAPASWPLPAHRLLEGIPIVSSDLLPAVRRGDIVVKRAIDRLIAHRVRFVDGSEERVDDIIYATGYRISLPFLSASLLSANARDFPLYRRIARTEAGGLYFAGFVDAPGGLLPLVETHREWIAAVLAGRLRLPPPEQMRRAIERAERRTRQRFPQESPRSIRCDPHAYRRLTTVRPAPSAAEGTARSDCVGGRKSGNPTTAARTRRTASRLRRKER
jgi:Flavin-binding monooxygenase-like